MTGLKKLREALFVADMVRWQEVGLLLGLLCVCFLAVYFPFLDADLSYGYSASDPGADTFQQYIPFYVDLVSAIRDGSFSWWNFNFGLGTSYFLSQSWLFDPFNIVLVSGCLVLGDAALPAMLLMIFALKGAIAVCVFDLYLSFLIKRPLARIVGSILFGMSGFMILWGSHYWFANALLFLAIVLLCLEANLKKQTKMTALALAMAVAFTLIWSIYIGFKILVFSALYVFLRLLAKGEGSVISRIKEFLRLAAPTIIGILLSCVVVVPAACILLFDTTRITQESGLATSVPRALGSFLSFDSVGVELARMMGNSLFGTIDASFPGVYKSLYEVIQVGLGCSFYVFLFIFVFGLLRSGAKREKIGAAIAGALILLYLLNSFLPSLLDVFAQFPPTLRSSFLLVAVFCLMISFALEQYVIPRKMDYASLAVGLLVSLIVVAFAYWFASPHGQKLCIVFICCTIALVTLLGLYQAKATNSFLWIALFIVIGSLVLDDYITVNYRSRLSTQDYPSSAVSQKGSSTESALAKYGPQGDEVYRVEKTYLDYTEFLDSFVQGYEGVTSYNSSLSGGVQEFYRMYCPSIFKLETSASFTVFSQVEDPKNVAAFLGVKYILSKNPIQLEWLELVSYENDLYVYENKESRSFASVYHSFISEDDLAKLSAEERDAILSSTLALPGDSFQDQGFAQSQTSTGSKEPVEVNRINDSMLEMHYNVETDGVLAIPIPNTLGWSATLDGRSIDITSANYGFIGLNAPAGDHEVIIRYDPFGWESGFLLSSLGLGFLVLYSLMMRKRPENGKLETKKSI